MTFLSQQQFFLLFLVTTLIDITAFVRTLEIGSAAARALAVLLLSFDMWTLWTINKLNKPTPLTKPEAGNSALEQMGRFLFRPAIL